MAESKKKRSERIGIDRWIAAILMFVMAAIAFANAMSRYFFHLSFAATEEITINLFVWMTVVGAGIAFEGGGQLGMVTLYSVFPWKVKRVVIVASALLGSILFLLVDIYTVQAIYDEVTLFCARSAALDIPVWIYYLGVPVLSVFVFRGIFRDARKKLSRREGEDG